MAENGPDEALNDDEIAAAQGGGVSEQAASATPGVLAAHQDGNSGLAGES